MARILTIGKDDNPESIRKKIEKWNVHIGKPNRQGFPAHRFTGKIVAFGDALAYQRTIRDEWE